MRKVFYVALIVGCFFTHNAFAKSVYCTNCSTRTMQAVEKTQSAKQLSELYKQVSEAVKQTQHQLEIVTTTFNQYQNMIQNTVQLPKTIVNELQGKLTQLAQLTNQLRTQRGDLTSLGQIFNELFPGQDILSGLATPTTQEGIEQANATYQAHWDDWSKKVDEAAQATFQLSGSQLNDMAQNSGEFQSYLNKLLQTPDGQMKAIMAGNQLSAVQIQEIRQLRELAATAVQSGLQSQMKGEKENQAEMEHWREITKIEEMSVRGKAVPRDPF